MVLTRIWMIFAGRVAEPHSVAAIALTNIVQARVRASRAVLWACPSSTCSTACCTLAAAGAWCSQATSGIGGTRGISLRRCRSAGGQRWRSGGWRRCGRRGLLLLVDACSPECVAVEDAFSHADAGGSFDKRVPRAVAGHRWMWSAAGCTLWSLALRAVRLLVLLCTDAASFLLVAVFGHVV